MIDISLRMYYYLVKQSLYHIICNAYADHLVYIVTSTRSFDKSHSIAYFYSVPNI